jgi:acyl-coenzyme A synthetase/AMP-(fatty) acid ligase
MFKIPKMETFFRQLSKFAKENKFAIISGNLSLSYGDFMLRILSGAKFLQKNNVDSSFTVAVYIKDEIEHLIATLSLFLVGANKITLASHDSILNHSDLISNAEVKIVLTTDQFFVSDAIKAIFWRPEYGTHYDDSECCFFDDGHIFIRTSGTTGKPNILKFNQEQLAHQSIRHPEYENETLLRLASVEYNNSIRHRLYCVYMGGVNVFYNKDKDPDLLAFIERYGVTCLDVSRMHLDNLTRLIQHKELNGVKIRTGGSPVPFSLRTKVIQCVSERLYVRYATSETGGISMANPKDHNKFESSGKPLKGVQIGIFDSNFSRLPNCSIGRIGMVIPGMANEYYKNPTQTAARFNNGWFFPGDTGFIQDDGSIVILAREDETIIMNGLNIFPKEIEQVLEAHPDVSNAVAVGIESRVHGTIPVAAVVLKPDVNLNPNELLFWSKELLALKSPKKIIVISKIPKSPEGKVLRKKVLDFFEIKSKKKVN